MELVLFATVGAWLLCTYQLACSGLGMLVAPRRRSRLGGTLGRMEWLFPIRGRWLRYLAGALLVLISLAMLVVLVGAPVIIPTVFRDLPTGG